MMRKTVLLVLVASGCAIETEGGPNTQAIESGAIQEKRAPVIVGEVNWTEMGALPASNEQRQLGRAVALLWLPARGSRCTGFLISADVIMTNHHCVASSSDAREAYAVFDAESGVPDSAREAVDCSEFIGANSELDFGLLRCRDRPGDRHGVVSLTDTTPSVGAAIFVIHQNCDYYSDPSCAPEKKLSAGHVTDRDSIEISHDADTLGGSSGAALFNAAGQVVGLHHVGVGGGAYGRGTENRAVRMSQILPVLRTTYPSVFDAAASAPPPADPVDIPADPSVDLYEPNNDTASATAVTVPFEVNGLYLQRSDRDIFKIVLTRTRTVRVHMTFSHAAGDLDLYLYKTGQSAPVARSEGVSDAEDVALQLRAGTYYVMAVPYGDAEGAYNISIQ